MKDRYRLLGLDNERLIAAVSELARREGELCSDLLAHLAELDQRRLFLDLGFSSLFKYCVEALGLSEPAAGRRIVGARVGRRFPGVFERVARGELNLTTLCAVAQHLTEENAGELLAACERKTRRQVEELLAARFPKADVKARVRLEPLSVDRYGVHFTIDAEALDEFERVRDLARHRVPDGDLSELFKLAMRELRKQLEKQGFAVGRKARAGRPAPNGMRGALSPVEGADRRESLSSGESTAWKSRQASAAMARAVYERDGGCCTFVAVDGRRCAARAFLEFDHVRPWALGGRTCVENLRLRCRAHNQHKARDDFGDAVVAGEARR